MVFGLAKAGLNRVRFSSLPQATRHGERSIGDGTVDADLGRGLIKQRVARKGQGRGGGFRTIIAYRKAERSVFLFGFAKSDQANLSAADQRDLADYGNMLLGLDDDGLETIVTDDELKEVGCQ